MENEIKLNLHERLSLTDSKVDAIFNMIEELHDEILLQEQEIKTLKKTLLESNMNTTPESEVQTEDSTYTAPGDEGNQYMHLMKPSAALAKIVGQNALSRTEVTNRVWAYIQKNNLQDAVQRRNIHADELLFPIFKKKVLNMFEMTKRINAHLS